MMQFVYSGWMSLLEKKWARLMRWSHDVGVSEKRSRMILFIHLLFVESYIQ